jgi:tetraacyldisaccharide 4'-kinase
MVIDLGRRPAIVSRGYGGSAGAGPLVVSSGRGPEVGPERCGDEPFLLARRLPRASVIVGADRVAGAREGARDGADIVILDDGFQHRRIRRDVDIVLLDVTDPFGGGSLLPAGRLREPVSALARADVVVVTRCEAETPITTIANRVADVRPDLPVVRAGSRTLGFVSRSGKTAPRPDRVVAFCAIGSPRGFRRALEATGVELVELAEFRDHHAYRERDLAPLIRRARSAGAALVTTEKDLARLERPDAPEVDAVLALQIQAVLHEPGPVVERVRSMMERE